MLWKSTSSLASLRGMPVAQQWAHASTGTGPDFAGRKFGMLH